MQLNSENYFSQEMSEKYMSVSQFKAFESCPAIMYGKSNRNSNGEYLNYGESGEVIKTGEIS